MSPITKYLLHFRTIKDSPSEFVLWILASVVLSLSSFWIPSLLGVLIGKGFYSSLMDNNPFIVFSIVFISNCILFSINYAGAGSNQDAAVIRGITLTLTIMFLIFVSTIIPLKLVANISLSKSAQYVLLIITILIGVWLYGFRNAAWEKSIDEARQQQDDEIHLIKEKAVTTDSVGGIKL